MAFDNPLARDPNVRIAAIAATKIRSNAHGKKAIREDMLDFERAPSLSTDDFILPCQPERGLPLGR
jgi:hypothetical protein